MPRNHRHFDADHLTHDLRRRSVRGVAAMFLANAGRVVLGLASAAILARLLNPSDFGLIAMVTAVSALFERVRTFGLGAPTVQQHTIHHQQVSNLFWLNVLIGLLLTIAFAALAPLIAWFYEQPKLIPVTIALAVSFLATAVSVQHTAILRRQMRFRALATTELFSEFIAVLLAVVVALPPISAGYWSLVVLNLTALIVRAFATIIVCRWIPSPPRPAEGMRKLIAFGSQVSLSGILQQAVQRLDRILIGKYVGAAALGYYSRSMYLLFIPVQQFHGSLRNVVVPALSRIQHDHARYRYYFQQAAQLVGVLGVPAAAFAFVAAPPLVLTLLGDAWIESIVLLRALTPAALIALLSPITLWIYFSLAHTRRYMQWVLLESMFLVVGFAVAMQWGTLGVALALSIVRAVLWPISVAWCIRATPVRAIDVTQVLWRPFAASLIAGAITALFDVSVTASMVAPLALALDATVFGGAYVVALLLSPGGAKALREMLALSRELQGYSPKQ